MMAHKLVVILLLAVIQASSCEYRTASVYCKKGQCTYKFDVLDLEHATAYGVYNDTLEQTGWGILNISAGYGSDKPGNTDLTFAAGYLEAILTQKRMYQHYLNVNDYFSTKLASKPAVLVAIKQFFTDQDKYMRQMIEAHEEESPYWEHMGYILAQYDGLVRGYTDVAPSDQELGLYAFQLLNGDGDMLDMVNALDPDSSPNWSNMSKEEILAHIARSGHCSVLIKALGAYEDLFMSHSTWFIYQATMRIYKHYDFNINNPYTAAKRLSFSSYPGSLESWDDFYLLSSQLVMLQTTNSIYNTSLYKLVKPQSLLAWHRVRLANMMAHGGQEWAEIFAQQNSGTYNNQYMLVDLKQIKLNEEIKDNALWVVEQIPGLVEYGDTSNILRDGYWASYNVPYFENIYQMSGYPEVVKEHGADFSYQLAPRAKIFRRDQGQVKDMDTMKTIMRYNDYKEDPYSEGDSCNSICCRGDLMKSAPGPFGCIDTKVSNYQMALNMTADIISGPTMGTSLPAFEWTDQYQESHVGLPEIYKFDFLQTKPLPPPKQ